MRAKSSVNLFELRALMEIESRNCSRGVGEGTATTAIAVPFVGTPKLSDTNFFQKKKEQVEGNKKMKKKKKQKREKRERESKIKLFVVKQWQ